MPAVDAAAPSGYAPPTARVEAPTRSPRRAWLAFVIACALATLLPAFASETQLGLPTFRGAEGAIQLLSFSAYCAVLVAFAILGSFFIAGWRVPSALLYVLAVVPAGIGLFGRATVLAARDQFPEMPVVPLSAMLELLSATGARAAAFGLATTGCAFVVIFVLAVLAHRAALARHGLDAYPRGDPGPAVAAVVLGACAALVVLCVHLDAVDRLMRHFRWGHDIGAASFAGPAACALAAVGAGLVAQRLRLLVLVQDERERGTLWRRVALLPVSAALAAACFEVALLFAARGGDSGMYAVVDGALVLVAIGAPLLRASAYKPGLRTIGMPFVLSCAVLIASMAVLVVHVGRLRAAEDEVTRLRNRARNAEWNEPELDLRHLYP